MALFLTLMVRDEADIIDANLRWHLEQGIDHILVTDHLSNDATPDILAGYARAGAATIIGKTDPQYAQSEWVTDMARRAAQMGADWVIHADADEFWMPPAGQDLSTFFGKQARNGVILGHRRNMFCTGDPSDPFWRRMIWRDRISRNSAGNPLPPKVAHRALPHVRVSMGNHSVSGVGRKHGTASGLDILHFPMRDLAQFTQKIRVGAQAIRKTDGLAPQDGASWLAQAEELDRTGRIAFADALMPTRDQIISGLINATVVRDTRLRDALDFAYATT